MSTLLIIGNGFDLALGYDSGYSHFVNTWAPTQHIHNVFWPFKNPDDSCFDTQTLHQYFYEYFKSHLNNEHRINWIDIEGELYNYAASKKGQVISEELISHDKYNFDLLVVSLYKYLSRHEEHKNNYHPPKSEDKVVIELLKALNKDKSFSKAYTFNYTDLRARLMRYGGFTDENMPEITYIHGSLAESSESNPKIVLGINNDTSIPCEYSFMQKICNPYANAGDLASDLSAADEIIFYGLSMGKIDFDYFQSFFRSIVNLPFSARKKHISIFTKGEKMVANITNNICEMGISVRELKEHSHFNIIDTYSAEFDDNGYYQVFQELLNRLKS